MTRRRAPKPAIDIPIVDMTIDEVVARLRVSLRTLDGWLSEDRRRLPDEQRFQFHHRHGRRRLWTSAEYEALRAAIARESEPGGVLGGSSRSRGTVRGTLTVPSSLADAKRALEHVLNFRAQYSPMTPPRAGKKPRAPRS